MLPVVAIWRMLQDGEMTFKRKKDLFSGPCGELLEDTFTRLWGSYQCYVVTEPGERRYPGDTAVHKVRDLGRGYSLWRCINPAGIPYSMIRDLNGHEFMSNVREKESQMLNVFREKQRFGIV